eukprot:jgi/Galph1/498/GphlegSOOS_G5156.1
MKFRWLRLTWLSGLTVWVSIVNHQNVVCSHNSHEYTETKIPKDLKLIFSQVLFRHGARSPVYDLPVDQLSNWNLCIDETYKKYLIPSNIVSLSPDNPSPVEEESLKAEYTKPNVCKRGQLTTLGVKQMVAVGELFHKRYFEELGLLQGDDMKDNDLFVRSTFMKRAVQSAQAFLYGFLSLNLSSMPNIPIHVKDKKEENLFPNSYICPRIKDMYRYARKLLSERSEEFLIPELQSERWNVKTPLDLIRLRDVIISREAHGLPPLVAADGSILPEEQIVERGQRAMNNLVLGYDEKLREESLRLSGGMLVKELMENMRKSVKGTQPYKCMLYSGHDTTLLPLLCMLDIYDDEWPSFGSFLSFEVFSDSQGSFYVGVFYNGKQCRIPKCEDAIFCPWERFEEQMSFWILRDEKTACQPDDPQSASSSQEMRTTYA